MAEHDAPLDAEPTLARAQAYVADCFEIMGQVPQEGEVMAVALSLTAQIQHYLTVRPRIDVSE